MEEKEFIFLTDQLGRNQTKCVLVLGPEFINIDSTEADFTESIHDYLAKKKFPTLSKGNYFSEDGFLLFDEIKEYNENFTMLSALSKFYQEQEVTPSYEKLARIPFTTIISLSPDDLMKKAYENINKDHSFCMYNTAGFDDGPSETSKAKPLIYNLVGHYSNENNLVFTFGNLFKFMNKIFQDTGFENFRKHIMEADSFLFLGFNYDKWYLKLIFFLLDKFRQNKMAFKTNAIFNYKGKGDLANEQEGKFTDYSKIEYYSKSRFRLEFSPENEKEFIEKLFNKCREKGILTDIKSLQGVNTADLSAGTSKRYSILFLSSSPFGKLTLRVGEQYQDIKKVLNKDFYELTEPVYNIKAGEINKYVNERSPSLIYITCHGNGDGELILSNDINFPSYLPLDDLKEMVKHLIEVHKQINCIVFSACKSEEQAKEISKLIPYCIGMNESVDEDISMIFTEGFFEGFVRDKQNIEYAFNNGVLAIKHNGDEQKEKFFNIPVLYKNGEMYTD